MSDDYDIIDARFGQFVLGNASVERLYTGTRWAEGPVYFPDAAQLLWSDIPNNRMLRRLDSGEVSVFRQPSNHTNGHTRDRQGRLVSCEHGARRVTRTELDGSITVLADSYDGRPLNSPNDVVVDARGLVWFTDPPYGIMSDYEGHRAASEQDANHVFRLDPATGALEIATDDLDKPNGLAFSTDGSVLYVTDSARSHDPDGAHHIVAFDVREGRELTNRRVFAEIDPGVPDGLRLDSEGFVWCSAADGIHCLAPDDGTLLGRIRIPEVVSNLTFGGPDRNRLFITATNSLYAVFLNRTGDQVP